MMTHVPTPDTTLAETISLIEGRFNRLDAAADEIQASVEAMQAAASASASASASTRPRWTIRQARRGKWIVASTATGEQPRFGSWDQAMARIRTLISRWAVADVLSRAVAAPDEYEGVPWPLIEAATPAKAKVKIYEAARYRGLSVHIAIEDEDDPRDTTIYVCVRPN